MISRARGHPYNTKKPEPALDSIPKDILEALGLPCDDGTAHTEIYLDTSIPK